MRVFVTMETVYVVDVTDTDPKAAEMAVENNWDTVYQHTALRARFEDRFLYAQAEPGAEPMTQVEKSRAEVDKLLRDTRRARERAMDRKYNLLRVSERRWSILRESSVATTMFQHQDVITFEQVTKPLAFDAALADLAKYRAKGGNQ